MASSSWHVSSALAFSVSHYTTARMTAWAKAGAMTSVIGVAGKRDRRKRAAAYGVASIGRRLSKDVSENRRDWAGVDVTA